MAANHADLRRQALELKAKDARRAAAWLVREHRQTFRRAGCVSFRLPKGAKMPSWMREALTAFRWYSKQKWRVVEVPAGPEGTTYVVFWTRWGHA
jgi:hypothetical protein